MMETLMGIRDFIRKHIRVGIDRRNDLFGTLTITYLGLGRMEIGVHFYRETAVAK